MTRHRHLAPRAILGICLLVATLMVATTAWSPVAAEATRSVTFILETPSGIPIEGFDLGWQTSDGSAQSATNKRTDASGRVTFNSVPMTEIRVRGGWDPREHPRSGHVPGGPTLRQWDSRRFTLPESGPVRLSTGPVPEITRVRLRVRMPDGTPVGENVRITIGDGFDSADGRSWVFGGPPYYQDQGLNWQPAVWRACPGGDPACPWETTRQVVSVDVDGNAEAWHFVEPQVGGAGRVAFCYRATYNDGDILQKVTADCSDDPLTTLTLPYMPVVAPLEPPLGSYLPTEEVEVTVRAVDGTDVPIAGQSVNAQKVWGTDSSVALSASCSAKLRATTGKAGYATLRICANKTLKWRTNGPSIVASRPFPVLIRQKGSPGGLRDVTVVKPAPGKVVLRWRAPKWQGWSAIRKYQVRWSTDGGYSWSRWQSTGLTRRYARRFTQGERYIIQLRAVNKRGGGVVKVKRIRA